MLVAAHQRSASVCPVSHVPRISQVGEAEKELMGATAANKYASLVDEAEGLDKIEDLQNHEQEEIYDKAANILEAFFDVEDGEVENLAPQVRAKALGFREKSPPSLTGCAVQTVAGSSLCGQERHPMVMSMTQRSRRGSSSRLLTGTLQCMEQQANFLKMQMQDNS